MAKTKRRAADSSAVASTRPSKQRKSANAAMIKLGEMEDAQTELDEILNHHESAEQQEVDERRQDDEAPVGFKTWSTSSMLLSGEPLSELAKVNNKSWQFTHSVEIHHREAFSLKPLIVTEGALKGHHILVLQPATTILTTSNPHFRFLDLPPEIRAIIFSHVFNETGVIKMSTHKPPHQPRRPVRTSFHTTRRYGRRPFKDWDRVRGERIGQEPSALTVLAVCKSVLEEAAPIIYGNNTFQFSTTTHLGIFLEQIGSMRQHIRTIHLDSTAWDTYVPSKAASVFNKLKLAKQLRTISFHDSLVQLEPPDQRKHIPYWHKKPSVDFVMSHLAALLKVLHKAQTRGESSYSVLDLVQVQKDGCWSCKNPKPVRKQSHTGSNECSTCKTSLESSVQKTAKFRRMIAGSLGIEDETPDGQDDGDDNTANGRLVAEENHGPLNW